MAQVRQTIFFWHVGISRSAVRSRTAAFLVSEKNTKKNTATNATISLFCYSETTRTCKQTTTKPATYIHIRIPPPVSPMYTPVGRELHHIYTRHRTTRRRAPPVLNQISTRTAREHLANNLNEPRCGSQETDSTRLPARGLFRVGGAGK